MFLFYTVTSNLILAASHLIHRKFKLKVVGSAAVRNRAVWNSPEMQRLNIGLNGTFIKSINYNLEMSVFHPTQSKLGGWGKVDKIGKSGK